MYLIYLLASIIVILIIVIIVLSVKLYNLNIHTIYSRIRYGWKGKDLLKPKTIGYEYLKGRSRNQIGQFISITDKTK